MTAFAVAMTTAIKSGQARMNQAVASPVPVGGIRKEGEKKMDENNKKPESMHYECPCGKTQHYADAKYCTHCGRKIEKPQR